MESNILKFDVSCEFCTVEFKPSNFNSITFFINVPPRNLQNPPLCDHNGFPEIAKPNLKCLKSLIQKIGLLLRCCKTSEDNVPTGTGDDRYQFPNKLGFHSRTSAIDRDERVREAIMYCKRTMRSESS
ncbi:hypothetical protein MA16_Dca012013 [Dendrobium catenatum]|uniref:Uncharacterized protein n=1 Tax=Dendrobium catenatum TaxID=906689 RepID=A0A2I0WDY2_9ASPA|nr:hypothetical protein MA16_Dca012013 [Dendrobium catenatum]